MSKWEIQATVISLQVTANSTDDEDYAYLIINKNPFLNPVISG